MHRPEMEWTKQYSGSQLFECWETDLGVKDYVEDLLRLGGLSWKVSLPCCYSSRTQWKEIRTDSNQNQGRLVGPGPPLSKPWSHTASLWRILRTAASLCGPLLATPTQCGLLPGLGITHEQLKKKKKMLLLRTSAKRMGTPQGMVPSWTQRYICPQADLTGLLPHSSLFTYFFKSPKPLSAQWCSFGSAFTDLCSELHPLKFQIYW